MISRDDWYLKEWLAALGKKQADIVRDLDWNKARISLMLSGKQPYTRDAVRIAHSSDLAESVQNGDVTKKVSTG